MVMQEIEGKKVRAFIYSSQRTKIKWEEEKRGVATLVYFNFTHAWWIDYTDNNCKPSC